MSTDYAKFTGDCEALLHDHILSVWFPACVDNDNGGFWCDFSRDWKRIGNGNRLSVFEGRMTWVAATVSMRRPERREEFLPVAKQGLQYLAEKSWDHQNGGFFWGLDRAGNLTPQFGELKSLYGISFCLYGAAAAFAATKNPTGLDLCKRAFAWIEQHAHDAKNGGYHEWLHRDGSMLSDDEANARSAAVGGLPANRKTMNTSIHLLESLTALYQVWPDEMVRARLEEMFAIVRDRICAPPGYMPLYFTDDWQRDSDRTSYGHNVETAYLLLEAAEALGKPNDPAARTMAKNLVDHSLDVGWDQHSGGFDDSGPIDGAADKFEREWWVEFEGLNALLLMHELHGKDDPKYLARFSEQWKFIGDHFVDREQGGIWGSVDRDGAVTDRRKSQIWKAAYHDSRAMMNVIDRLKRLQ